MPYLSSILVESFSTMQIARIMKLDISFLGQKYCTFIYDLNLWWVLAFFWKSSPRTWTPWLWVYKFVIQARAQNSSWMFAEEVVLILLVFFFAHCVSCSDWSLRLLMFGTEEDPLDWSIMMETLYFLRRVSFQSFCFHPDDQVGFHFSSVSAFPFLQKFRKTTVMSVKKELRGPRISSAFLTYSKCSSTLTKRSITTGRKVRKKLSCNLRKRPWVKKWVSYLIYWSMMLSNASIRQMSVITHSKKWKKEVLIPLLLDSN